MSELIGIKFKFYFNIFLQAIFSLILSIFIPIYITLNNSNNSTKNVYIIIIFFLILILFNVITIIYLNFNYFICNIKGTYDKDFSQKQNYLFGYIKDKMYQGSIMQIISNSFKYTFSNNYSELLRFSPSEECIDGMTGGGEEVKTNGSKETIIKKINPVPGSSLNNINNEKRISEAKSELSELSNAPLKNIFKLFSLDIVKKRFEENPKWSGNLKSYLFLLLLFFIIGSILDLTFISKSNMKGVNFLVSLLIVIVSYVPLIFSFETIGSFIANNNSIKIAILFFSGISLILSIFGMPFIKSIPKENWVFWTVIICFFLNIFLIIIGKLMSNKELINGKDKGGSGDGSGDGSDDGNDNLTQASAPELQEEIFILKSQLDHERSKRMLVEEELEKFSRKSNSENNVTETAVGKIGENINSLKEESAKKNENIKKLRDESAKKNESVKDLEKSLKELEEESAKKNENIKKLRDGIYSLTDILKKYKLDITKKYFTSIINILENKFSIKSLKGDISRKEDILKLLDNIKNNKIEDEELKKELEGLKNANTNIYNNIIAYFNKFKVHIDSFEGYE